jgi:hypothetical protein
MEGKRRALDQIAARQRAADEKRQQEIKRQQAAVVVSESVVLQLGPSNAEVVLVPLSFLRGAGALLSESLLEVLVVCFLQHRV